MAKSTSHLAQRGTDATEADPCTYLLKSKFCKIFLASSPHAVLRELRWPKVADHFSVAASEPPIPNRRMGHRFMEILYKLWIEDSGQNIAKTLCQQDPMSIIGKAVSSARHRAVHPCEFEALSAKNIQTP